MHSPETLDDGELALWHAFTHATERVHAAVERAIFERSGLTNADLRVLERLRCHGGTMRQSELARSIGWHKSRLSHQLARMLHRGHVVRQTVGRSNAYAGITPLGSAALSAALPAHAAAARRHLLDHIAPEHRETLLTMLIATGAA